ncbi:hypothetical protein F0L74_20485 [Chitinophaga agrisoli]|uniref:Uncharacterized protein n=1 Tax=Chitinophaga agrisoli TaxID=2607653 RepID=A0A5B2VI44_9BACT|nr:hypothetical protein [Chitinophaga agrisoli]KAA2238604.1 hypothetical protein F0L74_20485 [Chitinophaga agrisoli]
MKHLLLGMASMFLFAQFSMAQSVTAQTTKPAVSATSSQQTAPDPCVAQPSTLGKPSAPGIVKPPCSGEGQKLINGVCETGQLKYTRSVFNSTTHEWTCYYEYHFSDFTVSGEYFFMSFPGCP